MEFPDISLYELKIKKKSNQSDYVSTEARRSRIHILWVKY